MAEKSRTLNCLWRRCRNPPGYEKINVLIAVSTIGSQGMPNNKTVEQIFALNPRDRRALGHFLKYRAPQKHQLHALYDELMAHKRPDQPFRSQLPENRQRPLLSELKALLYDFYADRQLQLTPGLKHLLTLRQIRHRDLPWDERLMKKARGKLDQEGESAETYLLKYQLEREKTEHHIDRLGRGKQLDMGNAMLHLDFLMNRFFALQKAQHRCEQQALKQVRERNPDLEGSAAAIEAGIDAFLDAQRTAWPALQLYLAMLQHARTPTVDAVLDFDRRLRTLEPALTALLWRNLWVQLHNLYTVLINRKAPIPDAKVRDFFDWGLARGMALAEGGVPRMSFLKNMVEARCAAGASQSVAASLDTHGHRLKAEVPAAWWLLMGIVHFADEDFAQAESAVHQALRHSPPDDIYFKTGLDFLRAKIAYERGELDQLDSILTGLMRYLEQNKQLGQQHRDNLYARVKLFRRLWRLNTGNKPQVERLIADLRQAGFRDAVWLLAKAEACRDRHA